jgi:hypothetical protein
MTVAAVAGDKQSTTVATTVPLPPAVVVRDVLGSPLPGIPLQFAVVSGGGAVSAASAETDATGTASTDWTLGTAAGLNEVSAIVSGLSPVIFSATALAGAPAQMSKLTNDTANLSWNTYPLTDGVYAVYRKSTSTSATYRIVVNDGVTETTLSPDRASEPSPYSDYAVAGGWVGYTREDTAQALQVWRHGPAGEEQLTYFASSSRIDGVGADGTVVLTHGSRRYRSKPGSALEEIGSSLGKVLYRDGQFVVVLGANVLDLQP